VGTKVEVYNLMYDLASKGIGILLISSDLPELISLSNRLLVIWQGKIAAQLSKGDLTEEKIMFYATGHGENLNRERQL
jgi:ABC-type sugar transport system ATPase subunit